MSHYHRKARTKLRKLYDISSSKEGFIPKKAKLKKKVMKYRFKRTIIDTYKMKVLLFLNLISGFFILIGYFLPLVSFELIGLVGILINEIDSNEAIKEYSFFTLGKVISETESTNFVESFSLFILLFVYFIITFVAPLLLTILLFILPSLKLSLYGLKVLLYISIIVASWAALDLAFIGVFVTLIQVSDITQIVINFITNNLCFTAESTLQIVFPDDEAKCLDIKAEFKYGAIFIIIGVILQLLVMTCFFIISLRVVDDWYFYTYIKTGQRKQEGKPTKLDKISNFIVNFLTKQKLGQRASKDNYSLSQSSRKTQERTKNPLFDADFGNDEEEEVQKKEIDLDNLSIMNPMFGSFLKKKKGTIKAPKKVKLKLNENDEEDIFKRMEQTPQQKMKKNQNPFFESDIDF